jgi:hypothetical protein
MPDWLTRGAQYITSAVASRRLDRPDDRLTDRGELPHSLRLIHESGIRPGW